MYQLAEIVITVNNNKKADSCYTVSNISTDCYSGLYMQCCLFSNLLMLQYNKLADSLVLMLQYNKSADSLVLMYRYNNQLILWCPYCYQLVQFGVCVTISSTKNILKKFFSCDFENIAVLPVSHNI